MENLIERNSDPGAEVRNQGKGFIDQAIDTMNMRGGAGKHGENLSRC